MKILCQLIENYLSQKVPSILITVEGYACCSRYIVNVPTCQQRFNSHHKVKLQKGCKYFFTKTSTQTIAGLSGMMLTMHEHGFSTDTKMYLDENLYDYFEAMRYKMGFKFTAYSYCSWNGRNRLGIRDNKNAQQIFSKSQSKNDYYNHFVNLHQYIQKNLKQQQINNAFKHYEINSKSFRDQYMRFIPLHIQSNGETITNFICIPNKIRGKIIVQKLKEFGILNRQITGLLKNGSLTLSNGKVITADQIKNEDKPSPNLLIFHFNSEQSVKKLLSHSVLNKYLQDKENYTRSVIYIVQQKQIVFCQDFKILVSRFDKKVEHIMYNRHFKNQSDLFDDLFISSQHMNLVSQINEYFPKNIVNVNSLQIQYFKKHFADLIDIQKVFPNLKFNCYKRWHSMSITPNKYKSYQIFKPIKQIKNYQQIMKKNFTENYQQIHKNTIFKNQYPKGINFMQIDPKIVFLGTGSMIPSKYRNVSCIFIQYLIGHSFMFDCGEGSYYQLLNHYGPQLIEQVLLSLKIIFITHIHSDHNLGILDTISERNKLLKKYKRTDKLFLIIPFNVIQWLQSYIENIQNLSEGCDVLFLQWINNQPLQYSEATMSKDERKKSCTSSKSEMIGEQDEKVILQNEDQQISTAFAYVLLYLIERSQLQDKLVKKYQKLEFDTMFKFNNYMKQIGIQQFLPVPVIHCPQSHGIVITHKSGVKISYSGDTIPSKKFEFAAKNSTILIHEATFGDDLALNAKLNMHSTVGQAIQIGIKSNSWKTALTHFSQRYKSAKQIVEPALYKNDQIKYQYALNHTIVCFDHMQMRLSETPQLPHISRVVASMIPIQKNEL